MRHRLSLQDGIHRAAPWPLENQISTVFSAAYPCLARLTERFDVFVVDIWGVLIDGQRCMPGVEAALQGLIDADKAVVLVTNSSRRAIEVTQLLCSMGLPQACRIPILSSGELAHEAVCREWVPCKKRVWVLGMQPGSDWIYTVGCVAADGPHDADALFAWGIIDCDLEPSLNGKLEHAADRGLPMICSNPDRAVHVGGVKHATAGVVAAQYESIGGEVQWLGKPDPQVFHRAVSLVDCDRIDRVVVIGDSVETDVTGACAAGFAAVLVASEARCANLPLHAVLPQFAS